MLFTMSAREVIAQIKALPSNEKAEVYQFVCDDLVSAAVKSGIVEGERDQTAEVRYADDKDFQRAKEFVIKHHAPLLKKLAQ